MASTKPVRDAGLTDSQIVIKARGATNSRKFQLRFDEEYEGSELEKRYNTRWRAEVALLANLAFWTQRDRNQMWRLFKQSALYEEKSEMYNKYPEYRKGLLKNALEVNEKIYDPDYNGEGETTHA